MGSTPGPLGSSGVPGCMGVSVSNRKGSVPAPTWLLRARELRLNYKIEEWTAGTWEDGVTTFHEILQALHRALTPLPTFLREPGGHAEGCAWPSLLLAMTASAPLLGAAVSPGSQA